MNLEYVNAHDSPINAVVEEIQEVRKIGDHTFYYTGFHQGYFYFNPDFRMYPFDKQQLQINIENTLFLSNILDIQADLVSYETSGMDKNYIGISNDLLANNSVNLKLAKSEIHTSKGVYNSNFGDPDFPPSSEYSRLNFSVYFDRVVAPYYTKLFIPLGIILFLVYIVFFIPPDKLDMAAALTVTSLLSAIAFQFSVNSDLPEIGYLIYVDKIFYTTYFLIAVAMVESLWTFFLDATGNERKKNFAVKVDLVSRFLFPMIFVFSLFYFAIQ